MVLVSLLRDQTDNSQTQINTLRIGERAQKGTDMLDDYDIDIVFQELKKIGQCQTRSEFSRQWLGKNAAYVRSLKSKGLAPSAGAQIYLAGRLRDLGMYFEKSEDPILSEIGTTYLRLYGQCLDALLNRAQSNAINFDRLHP